MIDTVSEAIKASAAAYFWSQNLQYILTYLGLAPLSLGAGYAIFKLARRIA